MSTRFIKALSLFIATSMLASTPLAAEEFFLSRKFYAYTLLGVSGWCFKEAYDARQHAEKFNRQYKKADTDLRAQELFDDNKRYDTRTTLMLGLSTASLLYAIHLLYSTDKKDLPPPTLDTKTVHLKGFTLGLVGNLPKRSIYLRLVRVFGGDSE